MNTNGPNIVILIDHKRRDMQAAALIGHHLKKMGIETHLEPLEAYRGCLAAYRPHLILFNHLTTTHLVAYSKRLAQLGVRTAVLPNEGIAYNPDVGSFWAGKYHKGAHVDLFFCWNETMQRALQESGSYDQARLEVVGPPRFDFCFPPWSSIYQQQPDSSADRPSVDRPNLLICTNFSFARYHDWPRSEADKLFAPWKDRIPAYQDYWSAIHANHRSQQKVLEFIGKLVHCNRYQITLRPHPREEIPIYRGWIDQLPPELQQRIRIDTGHDIVPRILESELTIACEDCTTTIESWIAGKPTISLVFERHPLFFHEELARKNVLCEDPEQIVALVEQQLAQPQQTELQPLRRDHLRQWCASPSGQATRQIATAIADVIGKAPQPDWSQLSLSEQRRGLKLKLLRWLGLPYHFSPLLPLKQRLFPKRYAPQLAIMAKSIYPGDDDDIRRLLDALDR
ncbi:MAG: hypothetical protein HQL58_05450 [Magnetococcales bacterium]|nr:hypothetical protein [Magnetococcales bacterium]